jgi:hypothetical protein
MGSMPFRRRLTLLCLTAALCAAAPASAFGADRVVRPVQTYTAGAWTITPSGVAHDVLADSVAAPTVPDTTTGYLSTRGNGPITAEVGFAAPAMTAGETVTGATLWSYLETGSGRSLTIELRSGANLLGFILVPPGQPAGWREVRTFGTPTLAQLSDLRMRATVTGNGSSTDVKVFAAYVSVATNSPASTPTTTSGTTSSTPGTNPVTPDGGGDHSGSTGTSGDDEQTTSDPAAPVVLPAAALTLSGNGALVVPLTCRLAAGCTGTVTTRLVESAKAARRRKAKPKKARNRFRLAAGQSKRVPVQLDRRTSRVIKRKRRAKVAITVAIDGAAPVTKVVTVAARRGSSRRK